MPLALLIGRLVRFAVRLVRPGGGSALPGLVVSKLVPNLVYRTLGKFKRGLVIITGTAGKSTTTKMVVAIVRAHGVAVFTNPSTANIEQGFFSTIVKTGNLLGQVPGEIAILEMDEGHAAATVKKVKPTISAVLNVFEDQLDRFIDPSLVREKLAEVTKATKQSVVLNADDQNCIDMPLSSTAKASYFGAGKKIPKIQYAKTYAPDSPRPTVSYEAISLEDRKLKVKSRFGENQLQLPSRGEHFALDAAAALLIAEEVMGGQFDIELAIEALNVMPPVFSRGEVKKINGEDIEFILIQNPISFELNLANLPKQIGPIMLAIGRDVHDPSWLWTVDLSPLKHIHTVTGFNYADAALLLTYSGIEFEVAEADYFKAIDDFLKLPYTGKGRKTVLYSADAMRRLRRYLGFTDPEEVERV